MSDTDYLIKPDIKNRPIPYSDYQLNNSYSSVLAMNEGTNSILESANGELAFEAQTFGNQNSLEGAVNYVTAGGTTFQIQFSVIDGTNNNPSIGCTSSLCDNTIFFPQTESIYTNLDTVSRDSDIDINLLMSSTSLYANANTLTSEQIKMLQTLSLLRSIKVIDTVTVLNKSRSNYSEDRILKLFQGKKYASPRDIVDVNSVPPIDKVDTLFKVDFLSPRESLLFGVAFSEIIIFFFKDQSELLKRASLYLKALKATVINKEPGELGLSYTKLADQSDVVFEDLNRSERCTIEILRALVNKRAQVIPVFIKSRINTLAQGDKRKKKELENFLFNYLNNIKW